MTVSVMQRYINNPIIHIFYIQITLSLQSYKYQVMKKMRITQRDYIKANRKASREAEIENHTRPVNFCGVQKSKKVYDRKRSKADNKKALPYLFLYPSTLLSR